MPYYDYECRGCGNRFELRQGFDASSEQPCPQCQGTARRLIHAPPVIFKGSGWYVTDHGGKSNLTGDAESSAAKPAAVDGSNGHHGANGADHGHSHDHDHDHDHGHSHEPAAATSAAPAKSSSPKSDGAS